MSSGCLLNVGGSYDEKARTVTFSPDRAKTSYIIDNSLKKDIAEAKERVESMLNQLRPHYSKNYSIREVYKNRDPLMQQPIITKQELPSRHQIVTTELDAQDFLRQCKKLKERLEQLTEKYEKVLGSSKVKVSKEMPYLFYKPWKKSTMNYESPMNIRELYKSNPEKSVDELEKEKEYLLDECISLRNKVKDLEEKSNGNVKCVKRIENLENKVGKLAEVVSQWATQTLN